MNDLIIEKANTIIDGNDISSGSMELHEVLCSGENLRFGHCEASWISVRIRTVDVYKGERIKFTLKIGTESIRLGKYLVIGDVPTADKCYRDITAYDAMYDIINADVAAWYNDILPATDSTMTLREFRTSFFAYLGVEQEDVILVNDDMPVTRTIEASELSGKEVIESICEINGCFGHIGRDGKFQYIFLKVMGHGVYPSVTLFPSPDLLPMRDTNVERIGSNAYFDCQYEDYETAEYSKVFIRETQNDIGVEVGECGPGDDCYTVEDNFLLYGKSSEELTQIGEKMLSVIRGIKYRPAMVEAKGNPCLQVGDGIRVRTKHRIVYTYILQRTLKGIQALRDTYTAEGAQKQKKDINGTRTEIRRLKGKSNELARSIEETRLTIKDVEDGLTTMIAQNAKAIILEAKRADEAVGLARKHAEDVAGKAESNAKADTAEKLKYYSTTTEMNAAIKMTAENIKLEVSETYQTITKSEHYHEELKASIALNAKEIDLKVAKDDVISQINLSIETATIKAPRIDLIGLVQAQEFQSEFAKIGYATIEELLVVRSAIISEAEIEGLIVGNATVQGKLDVSEFNSDNINAMNITAQTITGNIAAEQVRAGSFTMTGGSIGITTDSNYDNRIVLQGPSETCFISPHGVTASHGFFSGSMYVEGCRCEWQTINGVKYLVTTE